MQIAKPAVEPSRREIRIPYLDFILRNKNSRYWTWIEIWTVVILIQIALWLLPLRDTVKWVGGVWLLLTALWDGLRVEETGLVPKNSQDTLKKLILPTFTLTVAVWTVSVLAGFENPCSRWPGYFLEHKTGYMFFALCQQLIMQSYLLLRLEKVLEKKTARLWTAIVFSISHVLNPILMIICGIGGWFMIDIFQRHRNLWVIALAHGIVGAAIAEFWPRLVMRVGIGGWQDFVEWISKAT